MGFIATSLLVILQISFCCAAIINSHGKWNLMSCLVKVQNEAFLHEEIRLTTAGLPYDVSGSLQHCDVYVGSQSI